MMFHFVVTVLAIENDWVFLSFFVFFCFHAFHVSCFHVVEKKRKKECCVPTDGALPWSLPIVADSWDRLTEVTVYPCNTEKQTFEIDLGRRVYSRLKNTCWFVAYLITELGSSFGGQQVLVLLLIP